MYKGSRCVSDKHLGDQHVGVLIAEHGPWTSNETVSNFALLSQWLGCKPRTDYHAGRISSPVCHLVIIS